MSLPLNPPRIILLILTFFACTNLFAITYTSIDNGSWTNTSNVWSTDGGITPCGCRPGFTTSGDDIVISHTISLSSDLELNGTSIITVNTGGNLNAPSSKLNMSDATMIVNGAVTLKDAYYAAAANTTVNATGNMTFTSNIEIENGGVVSINGGWIISQGNIKVYNGGKLNLNNGYMDVQNGNIENEGVINIGPLACSHIQNGGFINKGTGIVNGTGSVHITTNGVITNEGTWSSTVKWCSADGGVGLPTPEDCGTGNCFTALPVELTEFSAEVIASKFIQIEWVTISENNSSHFIVLSSHNGKKWSEVATVSAAGNTIETQRYTVKDYNVRYGTTYFKLIQVDINSDTYESGVISVAIARKETEIVLYPNPIGRSEILTISDLEGSAGQVNIMNISGQIVATQEIRTNQSRVEVQLSDLLPGIYIVRAEQLGAYKTKRLVIME
ncbi:MAG: T9SS type A sorting domain-containing protein [Crocinitomicaceae bacterium]|nr:T9SS type A sorting domain-containing protein [Crocinitomicaceae bacterium]